jgi:oxygen-dependent protoporphyrinogen oxidase
MGMSWWVDQITHQLDHVSIHRQASITRVLHDGEGWNLLGTDGQLLAIADQVIVACGAPAASRLLSAQDPQLAQELAAIPYASSAVGLFVVRRDEIATKDLCFGIVVPAVEKRPVLAISMTSEKYPGRVPGECCLLRVFMGGALRADLLGHDDARLLPDGPMASGDAPVLPRPSGQAAADRRAADAVSGALPDRKCL